MESKSGLSHPTMRYTHASQLFVKAADIYRTLLLWRKAAECYVQASSAEKHKANVLGSAVFMADAAELYERVDASLSVGMYRSGAEVFAGLGRHLTAGNLMVRVGELEAADSARLSAAEAYAAASHYYLACDEYALTVSTLHSAGAILALEDAFMEAHAHFERAARVALDDNLIKWHSPRLALNAGLCVVAAIYAPGASEEERGRARARLEEYQSIVGRRDPRFGVGREHRFLTDVADTAAAWAVDDLIDHMWNFDYVGELQPHELALCQSIYEGVREGPPKHLAKAAMAEADLTKVVLMEEWVNVEVDGMQRMSHTEMLKSGLLKVLEDEEDVDKAQAEEDAKVEFKLIHGMTMEEKDKRDRERDQRF